jgi:hypothetical protein
MMPQRVRIKQQMYEYLWAKNKVVSWFHCQFKLLSQYLENAAYSFLMFSTKLVSIKLKMLYFFQNNSSNKCYEMSKNFTENVFSRFWVIQRNKRKCVTLYCYKCNLVYSCSLLNFVTHFGNTRWMRIRQGTCKYRPAGS